MATPTYTALATTTLSGTDATVVFGSIPTGTYRDFVIVVNSKIQTGSGTLWVRLNADSGSNYSDVVMYGNGSSAVSNARTSQTQAYAGPVDDGDDSIQTIQIMDGGASDKHKTILVRENRPANWTGARVARWADTSEVSSITVGNDSAYSFIAGSTFSLYGIAS